MIGKEQHVDVRPIPEGLPFNDQYSLWVKAQAVLRAAGICVSIDPSNKVIIKKNGGKEPSRKYVATVIPPLKDGKPVLLRLSCIDRVIKPVPYIIAMGSVSRPRLVSDFDAHNLGIQSSQETGKGIASTLSPQKDGLIVGQILFSALQSHGNGAESGTSTIVYMPETGYVRLELTTPQCVQVNSKNDDVWIVGLEFQPMSEIRLPDGTSEPNKINRGTIAFLMSDRPDQLSQD